MQLRGVNATGPFRYGVHLDDKGAAQRVILHYVSDVLNPSGTGVLAERGSFTLDRCFP